MEKIEKPSSAVAASSGWKLVPEEPTSEMVHDGYAQYGVYEGEVAAHKVAMGTLTAMIAATDRTTNDK